MIEDPFPAAVSENSWQPTCSVSARTIGKYSLQLDLASSNSWQTLVSVGIPPVPQFAVASIIISGWNDWNEGECKPLDDSSRISKSELLKDDHQTSSLFRRELEVLGAGGIQGLQRGVSMSLGDLNDFGRGLVNKPLSTVSNFVQNHWSEAAVAGGLALLAPRKYLNTLLLVSSGRGVALATVEGAADALDTTKDLNAVRNRFANHLAGETRQLVNALPMTIAGGVAGRSVGNAVFGKGMGALDLAAGRVSMAEVKTNLWKIHDQVSPPKAKMAIVDLDGTLVATGRQLALGIEQGKKQLASSTGLGEQVVSDLMNEQFTKLKSFVNPWTVEMAFAEKLNVGKPGGMTAADFKTRISDPYWQVFKDNIKGELKVYDGAHETLSALGKNDVAVTIFTNSPAVGAMPRLEATGLHKVVKSSIMLDNAKPPAGLAPELVKIGEERMAGQMFNDPTFTQVARNLAKPNPEVVLARMKEQGVRPNELIVIGDSLESDMVLAQKTGARGLWSRWNEVDTAYDAMLDRVTGGNFPAPKKSGVPFEAELKTVPQILEHLRPPRDIGGLLKNNASFAKWYVPVQSYGLSLTPSAGEQKK